MGKSKPQVDYILTVTIFKNGEEVLKQGFHHNDLLTTARLVRDYFKKHGFNSNQGLTMVYELQKYSWLSHDMPTDIQAYLDAPYE